MLVFRLAHALQFEADGSASARDAKSAKCDTNPRSCECQGDQGRNQQSIARTFGNQPTGQRSDQRSRHRARRCVGVGESERKRTAGCHDKRADRRRNKSGCHAVGESRRQWTGKN